MLITLGCQDRQEKHWFTIRCDVWESVLTIATLGSGVLGLNARHSFVFVLFLALARMFTSYRSARYSDVCVYFRSTRRLKDT